MPEGTIALPFLEIEKKTLNGATLNTRGGGVMPRRWEKQTPQMVYPDPHWTINVGDRITFKAATRSSHRKATRVVTGFTINGRPEVRYEGWSNFVVSPWEIIQVHNEEKQETDL